MKRRLTAFLLALCMSVSLLPMAAFADDTDSVYTLNYDVNGGTGTVAAQTGGTVKLREGPAWADDAMRFNGWNTAKDGSGTAHAAGSEITLTADLTLYAQWMAQCKVTFDGNGGTFAEGDKNDVYVDKGTSIALTKDPGKEDADQPKLPEEPARAMYTFLGWNTDKDATAPMELKDEKGDPLYELKIGENVTLFAIWQAKPTHNITYKDGLEGAFFADVTLVGAEGEATPTFTGSLDREGWVFTGWTPEVETTVTQAAEYTATWAEDQNNNGTPDTEEPRYTIVYTDGEEDLFEDETYENFLLDTPTPKFSGSLNREFWIFAGWDKTTDEETKTITYTAAWTEDLNNDSIADKDQSYTVIHTDGVEGEEVFADLTEENVLVNDKYVPNHPTLEARTGWVFAGWTETRDGKTITYTAAWDADTNKDGVADKDQMYTVIYTDGVDDQEIFADQKTENILTGTATPGFQGETPVRTGWIFAGWDKEVAQTVTENATYTAKWDEDSNGNNVPDKDEPRYTVTYTDGVEDETVFEDVVHENLLSGTTVPGFGEAPLRAGWTFTGWAPADVTTVGEANLVFTAQWRQHKYRVSFHYNYDGAPQDLYMGQSSDEEGWTYTIPGKGPERANYTFLGWAETADGEVKYEAGEDSTLTLTDEAPTLELYAIWKANTYTITFDPNGGAFADQDEDGKIEAAYGSKLPAPPEVSRKDYACSSWNTQADGKGQTVGSDDIVTGDMTLYAQWTSTVVPEYTVTYTDGLNGKVFADKEFTVESGAATPQWTPTAKNPGYVFTGWDKEIAETVTENVTYKAVWAEDRNGNGTADNLDPHYDIAYHDGNRLVGIFKTEFHRNNLVGMPTPDFEGGTPTRTGYRFTGWNTKIDGTGSGWAETVTKPVTYYAQWEKIVEEVTVTFVDRGEVVETITLDKGEDIGTKNMPEVSRKGYTLRWYTEKNGKGTRFRGTTDVHEDMTVYAYWVKQDTTNAKTGDVIMAWVAVMLISAAGIAGVTVYVIKKRKK